MGKKTGQSLLCQRLMSLKIYKPVFFPNQSSNLLHSAQLTELVFKCNISKSEKTQNKFAMYRDDRGNCKKKTTDPEQSTDTNPETSPKACNDSGCASNGVNRPKTTRATSMCDHHQVLLVLTSHVLTCQSCSFVYR